MDAQRLQLLRSSLEDVYKERNDLLFHGWHHITFVTRKSLEFAAEFRLDKELLEAAALTHDLNFVADVKSEVDDGRPLRKATLEGAGYTAVEIAAIEDTVHNASTKYSGG